MMNNTKDRAYVRQSDNLTTLFLFKALAKAVVPLILCSASVASVQAQSCPNIPSGGGESISASISINSTGEPLADQGMVPAGTVVRIDALATAFGECTGMACCCVPTGAVYNRTLGQIYMTVDVSTTTGLNGFYTVGSVFGKNPDGTTANWNVLDTQASNSTGPKYFTLSHPGTYQFHIQGVHQYHSLQYATESNRDDNYYYRCWRQRWQYKFGPGFLREQRGSAWREHRGSAYCRR